MVGSQFKLLSIWKWRRNSPFLFLLNNHRSCIYELNLRLQNVSIYNSLGRYFINDNGIITCAIQISDDNLYLPSKKIRKRYSIISKEKKINSILHLPTSFSLTDLKKIIYSYRKSDYSGWTRDHENNIQYYLTEIDLKNIDINLTIYLNQNVTDLVHIKSGILNGLTLKGKSDKTVRIEDLMCDKIHIFDFNAAELNIQNIIARRPKNKETVFQIVNSNLAGGKLNEIEFADFYKVNIYRTPLDDVQFTGSTFPKTIYTIANIYYPDEKGRKYHQLQYDLYRQLKTSLLSQNNQIAALEMHEKMYSSIQKSSELTWQNKNILRLNQISNKHATSPGRALIVSLIITLFLWLSYCLFLPNKSFVFGWYGCSEFITGIKNYGQVLQDNIKVIFVLANPFHNTNQLNDLLPNKNQQISTTNYAISFASRILIAWIYYQFVSAFRKYGQRL